MKVAFIGASHWHLPLYLDPLRELPGTQVAGVADPDPAVAQALAGALGCRGRAGPSPVAVLLPQELEASQDVMA